LGTSSYPTDNLCSRLRLRFGVLGAFTFFLTTVCALTFGISAGLAAIVITQAQGMLITVYWLMRAYVEAEQAFNGIGQSNWILLIIWC